MTGNNDTIGVVRKHRWLSEAAQRERLRAEKCRIIVELDGKKDACSREELEKLTRPGTVVVFVHAFFLADPKARRRKGGLKADFDNAIQRLVKKRGGILRDLESSLTTETAEHVKAIKALAYANISRSNRGLRSAANGSRSQGRPKDWIDPAERQIIWEEWHSALNTTNGQASDAATKRIGRYCSPNTMWRVVKQIRAEKGIGGKGASGRRPNVKALEVAQGTKRGHGYVYFCKNGRRKQVKIGFGVSYKDRIANLNVASPEDLKVLAVMPGDRKAEGELHTRFRKYHIRGEWFKLEGDLADFIAALPKPSKK